MAFNPLAALRQLSNAASERSRATLGRDITVATAAYGNEEATRTFLASLFSNVRGDYELILVDDHSPDNGATRRAFEEAAALHRNTRIFSFTENQEYSGSLRAIHSHAGGNYIFFISNDIIVTSSYFKRLLSVARQEPQAGILRGSSNFVDNGLATHNLEPMHGVSLVKDVAREGRAVARRFGDNRQDDRYLTGDAFLTTRSLLNKIGMFDPRFYGYFADHDFGIRSKIAGFRNLLVPGAYAFHCQDANFNYLPEEQRSLKVGARRERVQANWALFKQKYGLADDLPYTSTNHIPWEKLEQVPFRAKEHYVAPGNYLDQLVYPLEDN